MAPGQTGKKAASELGSPRDGAREQTCRERVCVPVGACVRELGGMATTRLVCRC